ncbi:hypothetical protein [Exiguobacterium sp. S22-S28]|uniref:hypothetical protein n=1 Tax=Exiguobacterium sp. S22-S28 TaxID=3342768 RepID=UPI00372CEF3A
MKGFLSKMFPFPIKWPMNEIFDIAMKFATEWMNKKVSEKKPVTSESSASEYRDVHLDLEKLKKKVEIELAQIELVISEEITQLFDQYESLIESLDEKGISLSSGNRAYARELKETSKDYQGFIGQQVSISLSLTNRKLMSILAMMPGVRKEEAMNQFVRESIAEALFALSSRFETDFTRLSFDMTDDISEKISVLEQGYQNHARSLEQLLDDHVDFAVRKECLLTDAFFRIVLINELCESI